MYYSPYEWGSSAWKFIHYIVLSYPEIPTQQNKDTYRKYFELTSEVLPCSHCRINFKKHLTELPLTDEILSDKNSFILWSIKIHNLVNNNIGKDNFPEDIIFLKNKLNDDIPENIKHLIKK